MEITMETLQDLTSQPTVLRELSDIKSSLAVNTNETANMGKNITEIKTDIREIKTDFVNRREFKEAIDDIHDQISPLKKWMYGLMSAIGLAVLAAILKLVIK